MNKIKTYSTLATALVVLTLVTGCESNEPLQENIIDNEHSLNSNCLIPKSEAISIANSAMMTLLDVSETRSVPQIDNIEECIVSNTRSNSKSMQGWYIINYDDNSGFVVVSADSRTERLLAISDSGSLSMRDTVDNKGLAEYFSIIGGVQFPDSIGPEPNPFPNPGGVTIDPDAPVKFTISRVPAKLNENVCNWSQAPFLNKYTPLLLPNEQHPNGYQSLVGCVPLSVAMAMSHFEKPTKYLTYTINWDEVKANTSIGIDQAARLCEVLGRPHFLNANYQYGGTGVTHTNIPTTLKAFGFNNVSIGNMNDKTYEIMQNNDAILLVGGRRVENGKILGHRWVCDGQLIYYVMPKDSTDNYNEYLFHMVWGWGGKANGFYNIDPFKASVKPEGFNFEYSIYNYYSVQL